LEEASPWRHLHRLRSSLVGGEGRHGDIAQASRAAPAAVALAVEPPRLRCFRLLPPRVDALDEPAGSGEEEDEGVRWEPPPLGRERWGRLRAGRGSVPFLIFIYFPR
jgi:hypothetical protein